jgi:hypothetical protein
MRGLWGWRVFLGLVAPALHLWQGRTLWGMMLRDEQCLVDYLQTRPELDPQRVGVPPREPGSELK